MRERKGSHPAHLFIFPAQSKLASGSWIQNGHASSCGGQQGCRGQCYSRSFEGGKGLPTQRAVVETCTPRVEDRGQGSHMGGEQPRALLADISGAKGLRGHWQKAADLLQIRTRRPFGWKDHKHPPWSNKFGKGCPCRPSTRNPSPLPLGWGCSGSSPTEISPHPTTSTPHLPGHTRTPSRPGF